MILDPETGAESPYPAGDLQVFARQGRVVVFGFDSGSYGYDAGSGEGGILHQVDSIVDVNLTNADAQFN